MKFKIIRYERTFNLGNYEDEKIAVEVEVESDDGAINCADAAVGMVMAIHEENKRKREQREQQAQDDRPF